MKTLTAYWGQNKDETKGFLGLLFVAVTTCVIASVNFSYTIVGLSAAYGLGMVSQFLVNVVAYHNKLNKK